MSARAAGRPGGQRGRRRKGGADDTDTDGLRRRAQVTGRTGRPRLSEGARAERRLGWLLCAPAVIVMLAVAAYPIVYAVWLSLQRYDLRFPELAQFIGLRTTGRCCVRLLVARAVVTLIITVVSVAIEFVAGHGAGAAHVPDDLRPGHGPHRHPDPYGIVTVAAAFSWQYAWTPDIGYLSACSTTARR